jgi:2-oxoisovalerate dehydrogenase E1 component
MHAPMIDRAVVIDRNLIELLTELKADPDSAPRAPNEPIRPGTALSGREARDIFTSQVLSRHVDLAARNLKARGLGFYTIGSSGHEGNAAVAAVTRHTDPAMLHYRSGAFMMERARTIPGETQLEDVLLSLCASREDPISGGRHKVFGSVNLSVPPMTSTIASHLPRAIGAAFFHERARRIGLPLRYPEDSIFLASFGDASANHSVAAGAFNAAGWAAHQGVPLPLLFICEDNGIGISVPTPEGWVERSFRSRPGFEYVRGNGLDLASAYDASIKAVDLCRELRTPVFLHLRTVRLLGHAGNDVEWGYRSMEAILESEAQDPLAATARLLVESGAATAGELLDLYENTRERVARAAEFAGSRPRLTSAAEVTAPLTRRSDERVAKEAARVAPKEVRSRVFGGEELLPECSGTPRTMAQQIALGLRDLLAKYDDAFVFGEDVAQKGGVYYNTAGLFDAFGPPRVFNTLLDETTILGLALGGGMLGYLPIPEIQYLAYLHNAIDQLRGEAASLSFFSNGAFTNPMVIRIASFGYQKGFGGHFHNDNSITALRDIPGLVIVAPSRPADAVRLLRTACALARVDGKVVVFLEPIALYHEKDLHEPGDGLFQQAYPAPEEALPFGQAGVIGNGEDLAIITYANGVRMSERAAQILETEHGIKSRVVDLRWLAPLDEETIINEAERCGRILVVDEGRRSGGVSEPVLALLAERAGGVAAGRVTGVDTFIPLGDAANLVLPSVDSVVSGALRVCG